MKMAMNTPKVMKNLDYKKLIVTLHKKEMDSIIRKVFANYPDNLKHYEALFLAQGNMGVILTLLALMVVSVVEKSMKHLLRFKRRL